MSFVTATLQHILGWLEHVREPLIGLGWMGVLAYAGGFVVLELGMLPVMPFGMAAGAILVFGVGFAAIMIGCILGTILNFLISRHVAHDLVSRKLSGNRQLRVINAAVTKGGLRIVFLLRFLPIPFGLANYAYGITAVAFRPFVIGTALAVILPNALFVWLGDSAGASLTALAGKGRPHSRWEWVLIGVAILAIAGAIRYITTIARQELGKSEPAA